MGDETPVFGVAIRIADRPMPLSCLLNPGVDAGSGVPERHPRYARGPRG